MIPAASLLTCSSNHMSQVQPDTRDGSLSDGSLSGYTEGELRSPDNIEEERRTDTHSINSTHGCSHESLIPCCSRCGRELFSLATSAEYDPDFQE